MVLDFQKSTYTNLGEELVPFLLESMSQALPGHLWPSSTSPSGPGLGFFSPDRCPLTPAFPQDPKPPPFSLQLSQGNTKPSNIAIISAEITPNKIPFSSPTFSFVLHNLSNHKNVFY